MRAMAVAIGTGRAAVVGSLLAVIALSWAWLVAMPSHGSASYAASMLAMWLLMMVAMMLPSALPMILVLGRFGSRSGVDTALFAAGYLIVWALFSVLATAAQWGLARAGLLSADLALAGGAIAAAAFIAVAPGSSRRSSGAACTPAARRSRSSLRTGARAARARSSWGCTTAHSAWAAAGP